MKISQILIFGFLLTVACSNSLYSNPGSPQLKADKIHIGMTLEDFLEKYPASKLSIDVLSSDFEYISVQEPGYSVEFLTTESNRVADYNYSESEPEFISVKRSSAKIDRISVNK